MNKKICFIYTGGTIGMKSVSNILVPCKEFKRLITNNIKKSFYADMIAFDVYSLEPLIDSANASPKNWLNIAKTIMKYYDNYSGFVILHGTDTMAYTASILSFMLNPINKPIIITGSQFPVNNLATDGWQNIFGATACAIAANIQEVCIFFNGMLLRGNRCTKINSVGYKAFDSPNYPALGNFYNNKLQLNQLLLLQNTTEKPVNLFCNDEQLVHIVFVYPGFNELWLEQAINLPYKAIILLTFGIGNIPEISKQLIKKISALKLHNKLLLNINQCFAGETNQEVYATGSNLVTAGAYTARDITLEAAFCKLHYLYSRYDDVTTIAKLLTTNLAGEMSATYD